MLRNRVKQWEQEIKQVGREEGRKEARLETKAGVLRSSLALKFGPVPSWIEEKIQAASDGTLE